ncbi:MAG: YceI family protein [Crocinitomicaceae bacterium]|nr:YceI family protein [Crocinitomicaceae bacterium]
MKKLGTFLLASVALVAVSCSSAEGEATEDEVVVIESVTYSLDTTNSSLVWAANMGPDYGHEGLVDITEGSIVMEGEALTSGSFTVDMNTIRATGMEEEKAGYLRAHLMGTAPDEDHPANLFFNSVEFPTIGITLGEYKDGMLGLTLSILGKELSQDVAVELTSDENGASINGEFALDLNSLEIPGLQPNPEDGSQINPAIDFKLNVALTK